MSRGDGPCVKVGILSDSGTWAEGGDANLVDIATFNEFGTSTIPERPFMRQTWERRIGKVVERFKQLAAKIFAVEMNTKDALVMVGDEYKGFIQSEITEGGWTPNAPSTIRQKKSSKPLIDTGRMRGSVNFELEGI